jgi:hypothetical protein
MQESEKLFRVVCSDFAFKCIILVVKMTFVSLRVILNTCTCTELNAHVSNGTHERRNTDETGGIEIINGHTGSGTGGKRHTTHAALGELG